MFNKKKLSLLLTIGLSVTLLVGCGVVSKHTIFKSDKLNVKLLLAGELGDKSINDSASAGAEKIKEEFGDKVNIEVVEIGFDKTKFETALVDAAESNVDVIITGQVDMKEHVENIAELYPNKKFLVYDTDVNYDKNNLENVYSMTYKQNEAGFLAGTLAALVTTSDMELANEEKIIGFIGARDTSAVINDFLVGYIEGAKFIDEDIKVEVAYVDSFTDTAKAKELTLAQYSNGADVVFTAAGAASAGSIEAARKSTKYVIGVDSDQALAYEGKEEQKYIISSALKKVDNSIALSIESFLNNSLEFNSNSVLGVKEGVIGLAENDIYTSTVSEKIRSEVSEITKELKCGKIQIKSALGMNESELKKIISSAK